MHGHEPSTNIIDEIQVLTSWEKKVESMYGDVQNH